MTDTVIAERVADGLAQAGRAPVWRGLGVRFEGPITASDAIRKAGLDFGFDKAPMYSLYPAYDTAGRPITGEDGSPRLMRMEHPTQVHLIRQAIKGSPPEIVGVVHRNYPVLDNLAVAALLDDVTDEWPVETAGALGKGEKLFLVLAAGVSDVQGEEIRDYFVVYDPRGDHRAMNIFFAPVIQRGQLTLRMHLGDLSLDLKINHVAGRYERDAKFAVELFSRMGGIRTRAYAAFNHLAVTRTTEEVDARAAEIAFPDPGYPKSLKLLERAVDAGVDVADLILRATSDQQDYEREMVRAAERRTALRRLCEEYDAERAAPGTLWRTFRAAVEMQDYAPGFRDGNRATAFVGDRARTKEHVFDYLMEAGGA